MNKDFPASINLINRKYWIFDLDGTLTVPVHDFPQIRRQLGIPENADILKYILSQEKAKSDQMFKILDEIEKELAEMTKPAEGALELIPTLVANGAKVGIITRNTKENAERSLEKIGLLPYFSRNTILGRTEAPPKPDPYAILHLMKLWQASVEQTVMVGDYLFDLQTGRAAGTATIHVNTIENKDWAEFTDLYVKSLLQLAEMLESQINQHQYQN